MNHATVEPIGLTSSVLFIQVPIFVFQWLIGIGSAIFIAKIAAKRW